MVLYSIVLKVEQAILYPRASIVDENIVCAIYEMSLAIDTNGATWCKLV